MARKAANKGLFGKVKRARDKTARLFKRQPKLKFHFGWHYKHIPVAPNRILFESFHGKNISDSPLAVLEELVASGEAARFDIYYSTDDVARDSKFVAANHLPVKLVDVNTRRYTYILATAKYLINNSSFPAYFIRKPDQVYVQTWHGTPWKTLGKRMRLGIESMYNVQHNFLQASCLTFPNEFTREAIMRDYNLEDLYAGKVAMVGYPRNAVFLKGRDEALRARLGLDGIEAFAYMPTWRGTSNHSVSVKGYAATIAAYFEQLDASLRDDQRIYVNFHSMVASSIKLGSYKHITAFPKDVGNYAFLAQMDALITDYSSVFFDFALTGRPIVLFAYDVDEYLHDRGLYFPIDELPFPIVTSVDDLCACLADGTYARPVEGRAAFAQKYLAYDTPDNAKDVLNLLLGRPAPAIKVRDYSKNAQREWRLFCPGEWDTLDDIDSMFAYADPARDILVFNRSLFGPSESAVVHDRHRDQMNYLFRTKTTPRTYVEDVLRRTSPDVRRQLRQREHVRILGDVPVSGEYRDFSVIEAGGTYSQGACADLPACIAIDGTRITVTFDAVPGTLKKVFLALTLTRQVVWTRELSADEIAEQRFTVDVVDLIDQLAFTVKRNGRYAVGVSFAPADGGDVRVGNPLDTARATSRAAIAKCFYAPIVIPPERMPVGDKADRFEFRRSYMGLAAGRDLVVTPHYNEHGTFALHPAYEGDSSAEFRDATMMHLSIVRHDTVKVRAKLKAGDYRIVDVVLGSRVEAIGLSYSVPYTVSQEDGFNVFDIRFCPRDYHFEGAHWDLKIVVEEPGGRIQACRIQTVKQFRRMSKLRNWQADTGDGGILFPYTAMASRLAFTYRPKTKTDTALTRVKEAAAFGTFALFHSRWKKRRIWLVFEKYCSLAQDNGFYFFKYCMEELPPDERKHVFYVIDKSAPDYANVAPYADQVIDFMSFKHMLYAMAASVYVGSDSKSHLYQWRPKPSLVWTRINRRKILFLQHGVTAMKRVHGLFGAEGSSPMTYFLTTSEKEQDIVTRHFGYDELHAPVLGFSRWDVLKDLSHADAPLILLMPTWRSWLEELSDEAFMESEYFKTYSALVQSAHLQHVLERHNATLKLFIHPKLSEYLSNFTSDCANIDFVPMGSVPLNRLIMECSMLVTDYSSVCWDVLYMDKPVVYYQFDQAAYVHDIGSYVDFDSELPGKVCKSQEACVDAIDEYATAGFAMDARDAQRAREFLPVRDKNNRARTYRFLVDQGF